MKKASAFAFGTCLAFATLSTGRHHAQTQTTPYLGLDRIEDAWVNHNPVPYRPMVSTGSGILWAVNPYLSEVVKIEKDPSTFVFNITQRFRTMPGPVSIALYQPPGANQQLLVVCQHSNAMSAHDVVTGDMLYAIAVPAGPGDILVDQTNNRAWVSCPLADKVVEINLTTKLKETTYDTSALSRSPGFLSMYNGEVLVAPRVSGNGSLVDRKEYTQALDFNEHAGEGGILDTTLSSVATTGLPDHDLLWLDSAAIGVSPDGQAKSIAKSTGTLLFAHAVQPLTQTLWQLNLEANNKDTNRQSESGIRGEIVFNRLTKIPLQPSLTGTPTEQTPSDYTIKFLDDVVPSTQVIDYAVPPLAIGTPYSLTFNSSGSICAVTGLMSDNVLLLNSVGNRLANGVLQLDETPVDENTMP